MMHSDDFVFSEEEVSVKVVCRLRPLNDRELKEAKNMGLSTKKNSSGHYDRRMMPVEHIRSLEKGVSTIRVHVNDNPKRTQPYDFNLDMCLEDHSTQEATFEAVAKMTCKDAIKGINGTIFAYGQTGSGKTYSMYGLEDGEIRSEKHMLENLGMVPRCVTWLFQCLETNPENESFTVKCSFLEEHINVLKDLLNPVPKHKRLKMRIRETQQGSTFVEYLTVEKCETATEVLKLIHIANENRQTSSTQMNRTSSRSHSIMTLYIEQTRRDGSIVKSKVNFVDLAGSERIRKTGATGQTLNEARKINKSLTTLGRVIKALSSQASFIPYRDSQITYVLKDALGGNSKTTMLVCCSPSSWNVAETVSTLQFGERCKFIKNLVHENRVMSAEEMRALIAQLKAKVKNLQNESATRVLTAVHRSAATRAALKASDIGAFSKGRTDSVTHVDLNVMQNDVISNGSLLPEAQQQMVQNLASTKEDNKSLMAKVDQLKAEIRNLNKALMAEKDLRMHCQTENISANKRIEDLERQIKELEKVVTSLSGTTGVNVTRSDITGAFQICEEEEKEQQITLAHTRATSKAFPEEIVDNGFAKAIRLQNETLVKQNEAINQRQSEFSKKVSDYAKVHDKANKYRRELMEMRMKLLGKDKQLEEQDNNVANLEKALEETRRTNEVLLARLKEMESVLAKDEDDVRPSITSPVVRRSNPRKSIKYAIDVQRFLQD